MSVLERDGYPSDTTTKRTVRGRWCVSMTRVGVSNTRAGVSNTRVDVSNTRAGVSRATKRTARGR